MKETCAKCNNLTAMVRPARFQPEDRLGKYRREYKKQQGLQA